MLNPCARESRARIGRLLREKLISDHGIFSSYGGTKSGERAWFVELFQGRTRFWTAGCWLAHRLHKLKASTTIDIDISFFFYFCIICGFEKLGLV